jgi:gluconolactonase
MQMTIEGDLSNILEGSDLTVVASGYRGTEGPVWHAGGYLTFVDLEGDQLVRWDPQEGARTLRDPNAHGNGCTLDAQGRLVMCEGDSRSIMRQEVGGTWTNLAHRWNGRRLNRPNDIIRRSDGTFFFTDPNLFVPMDDRDLPQSVIWSLSPLGELNPLSTELAFPNGLALSPDERTLYVTNSFLDKGCLDERKSKTVCSHRYLAAFDVSNRGQLSGFRRITDLSSNEIDVPDGLKVDQTGNIFCTGSGGIWVLNGDGGVIGKFSTPEGHRNCAFGGADMRTLFICTLTTVYSIRVLTPGISGTGTDRNSSS